MENHIKTLERCLAMEYFIKAENEWLGSEITLNKYYLSEKAKRDVGKAIAELDYIQNHLPEKAKEFRIEYCSRKCPIRVGCYIINSFDALEKMK
jgi:hypothetical protein